VGVTALTELNSEFHSSWERMPSVGNIVNVVVREEEDGGLRGEES